MGTTDADRAAILGRLEEIFSSPANSLGASSVDSFGEAKAIAASTSDKEYFKLTGSANATSFSKLTLLHECPRKYELEGLRASSRDEAAERTQTNVDFAFGHAVGSGIQTYGATGNLVAAQFAAFLAWKMPWDAEKTDKSGKPVGKSLALALYAVEKFQEFRRLELGEYDVLRLPDGRPATELSFAVDTQNGFFHFGHIDTVLQHRTTKRLAVWEGKTSGKDSVTDADFANSYQALGYSVVLDAISEQLGLPGQEYEVLYITYSSKSREFMILPFTKNRSQRAEWLQDLLLNHAMIKQYRELNFFPKRGNSCINQWGRQCQWFGNCQMRNESLFPGVELRRIDRAIDLKSIDFHFTLEQLIASQRNRALTI